LVVHEGNRPANRADLESSEAAEKAVRGIALNSKQRTKEALRAVSGTNLAGKIVSATEKVGKFFMGKKEE
jgi:hypothetical protein